MKELKTIFLLLNTLFYSCVEHKAGSPVDQFEGKVLPIMNLMLVDSITKINMAQLIPIAPIIIFYFDTKCPYCRAQTREMIKDIFPLKKIKVYMLATSSLSEIKNYEDYFDLRNFKNVIVAQNYDYSFINYFKNESVPCTAIYGSNKRLKKFFEGKVSTHVIKDFAQE